MLIILLSHKPQQLLPTILSRCRALSMPLPATQASVDWLKQQGISHPAALLAQAGYAPLLAANLAEQSDGQEERAQFLQEISRPAQLDALALAERIQRTEPATVVHWLQQWCYDLGSAKLSGTVRYNTQSAEAIKTLAGKISVLDLMRYQRDLATARREAYHPLNARLQFESLLLAYRQMMQVG
jgi:DNA polymerase-3 subunit delta'